MTAFEITPTLYNDNDGVNDTVDAFAHDNTESIDTDGDGTGDNTDTDDDNGGVEDNEDAFPTSIAESKNSDADGIGDNQMRYQKIPPRLQITTQTALATTLTQMMTTTA